MNKRNIGYITGPVGLKGEFKVYSESNHLAKIFMPNQELIINDQTYRIHTVRQHQNHFVISLIDYSTIESIEGFFKKDVYIDRDNLNLEEDEYLIGELMNYQIKEKDQLIGFVEAIYANKNTYFIKTKQYLIPLVPKYLVSVDNQKEIVYVKDIGELSV